MPRPRPRLAAGSLAALIALSAAMLLVLSGSAPGRAAGVGGALTYDVSSDGRAITPAGTLIPTAGFFAAGVVLDHAESTAIVANASKFTDQLQSFSTAAPEVSAATVPLSSLNPLPGELPDVQSGELHLGPDGRLYDAGGASGTVRVLIASNPVVQVATYQVGAPNPLTGPGTHAGYIGDVAVLPNATTLLASEPFDAGGGKGDKVVRYDTSSQSVTATATVGLHPFALAAAPTGADPPVAVADQDSAAVTVLDPATMTTVATIPTGRQPDALAFTPDGRELLVVDSLDDSVAVVDTATWTVRQRVDVGVESGLGAEPNAIAIGPDGRSAYVTDAADNAIAVLGRPADGDWAVSGLVPTGKYPTGIALAAGTHTLWVSLGKAGSATVAGSIPSNLGGLEEIPVPDAATLATDTAAVRANDVVAPTTCATGAVAGIRHVVLIIRENKTYDAEFGDLAGGNPAYLEYGRQSTPNSHALAGRWSLLENFNGDEEVSDAGHQVLMGGVANDWVQRQAEQSYNLGGAPRPGAELGNDDDVLWAPNDYLFEDLLAHHVSFLDYGEFYRRDQRTDGPASPELGSHIETGMPGFGFDPGTPDTKRVAYWRKQFATQVSDGSFPALTVLYLPEDHTTTVDNGLGPAQTQVADSDLATGQVIDTLSHSPEWASTAVFLEEDDSQDAMDHIDPHRSLALVLGPHVRRNVATAVPYDQLSILRTIELILGLPPLTEHDATARPMLSLFTPTLGAGATAPYTALTPNPPAASAATLAAVRALSRRAYGPHPTAAEQFDSHHEAQFQIQWLSTHGHPFHPTRAVPGIGAPTMIEPAARSALLARARAEARATASADCPALPAKGPSSTSTTGTGNGAGSPNGTGNGAGSPNGTGEPGSTRPQNGSTKRPGTTPRYRCRSARGIGLSRPPGPASAAVAVTVRIDGHVRYRLHGRHLTRFRIPWPTPRRFRLDLTTRFADGEVIATTVRYDMCRRGRVTNRRVRGPRLRR